MPHNLKWSQIKNQKRRASGSWRTYETDIKVKRRWVYSYRAVDKFGAVIDVYLSETRDEPVAWAFFNKAINQHGLPEKVVIDKSGGNVAALDTINIRLWLSGWRWALVHD